MHSSLMLLTMAACASMASAAPWYPRPFFLRRATFARWLVHETNWTILATSSQQYHNVAYPNLLAVSDGTGPYNCTGQPYLYVTNQSTIAADIRANPNVTLGFYEVGEGDKYCLNSPSSRYDPEDPNCGKVHLTGKARVLAEGRNELAEKYLFWRHPAMKSWPSGHHWLTITIDIETVDLLDFYGPQTHLTLEEYHRATCH